MGASHGVATMDTFNHLLNWKLKAGSHLFPGPDGGTCINEAALVAAGFEYKPIPAVSDMPECFSRPICKYAMWLNDTVGDTRRQHLLPYVTRLACVDDPQVERRRAAYIWRRTWFYFGLIPFERALEVLDGALAIGRQADPFPAGEVQARLEAVRGKATKRHRVSPLSAKQAAAMMAH